MGLSQSLFWPEWHRSRGPFLCSLHSLDVQTANFQGYGETAIADGAPFTFL